jgi:hypothetical protein
VEPTYTRTEIAAALRLWYQGLAGRTQEEAEEVAEYLVQLMEEARK